MVIPDNWWLPVIPVIPDNKGLFRGLRTPFYEKKLPLTNLPLIIGKKGFTFFRWGGGNEAPVYPLKRVGYQLSGILPD